MKIKFLTVRRLVLTLLSVSLILGLDSCTDGNVGDPPNIVLIMTDDQGYGDVGFHGNQLIETPNLDRLSSQSIELTNFYVSPVCAPTRASLMTGRYNYRTGVVDTWIGRAMMYPDEETLAELLTENGYRTGIFGKWHLGDNYPLRAMDQGFQESLVHRGGGIGQPSDPPGNRYFDPILLQNGADVETTGYCTDIFFEAARQFIKKNLDQPFFAYIATNTPHTPLQISDELVKPYLEKNLDETTSKIYGMVTNIDENVGELLSNLDELGLRENTIVIFMTDNGPQQERYTAGLRGRKASVYDGGIRVPFLVRWPAKFTSSSQINQIAAHIDIVPTLLDACGIEVQNSLNLDGISLLPLLTGEVQTLPERNLFIQSHRGDVPERGRACAVRNQHYKLVQAVGWPEGPMKFPQKWELFDMKANVSELDDISSLNPDIVEELKTAYNRWFDEISEDRGFDPPRIQIGTIHENPVVLTRQDWRGPKASWSSNGLGYWEVDIINRGSYQITFRFSEIDQPGIAELRIGSVERSVNLGSGTESVTFDSIDLPVGENRLEAILHLSEEKFNGVYYVDIDREQ